MVLNMAYISELGYNQDIYNTNKKNIERSQLELGKTCYNDKECKSEKCSNIKLFRLPGKCVPALSKSAFR